MQVMIYKRNLSNEQMMLFSKKINIQSSEIIDEIIDWKIKKAW